MADELNEYDVLANAYEFLGALLLKPASQAPAVALDPQFWVAFTAFASEDVVAAANALVDFASAKQADEKAVEEISVEFTRLFIGPPKPAAAPWESFYRGEDVKNGFGPATFAMQEVLRELGLKVSGENNQYADHIGIELFALAQMCRKVQGAADEERIKAYLAERPLGWVASLKDAVAACEPDGYYVRVIALAQALMEMQAAA